MRLQEDTQVSEALRHGPVQERVDLLLGGHDHQLLRRHGGQVSGAATDPRVIDCCFPGMASEDDSGMVAEARGNVRIVKSGTDWKNLSCVRLKVQRNPAGSAIVQDVAVEQVADLEKLLLDKAALSKNRQVVDENLRDVHRHMRQLGVEPLLHSCVGLEGTGSIIRCRETNLGNMLADMVRAFYQVDIGLVNSGSVRCDKLMRATMGCGVSRPQPLTLRDLVEILPFNNALVVKRVQSGALLDALENSFSDAHTDGRFLQLSGLAVTADWSRREGERVLQASRVEPRPNRAKDQGRIRRDDCLSFTVAMPAFIADGFDGYTSLAAQETLMAEKGGMTDTQLLLRTFGVTSGQDTAENQRRIEHVVESIVIERDSEGLPVVAPSIKQRITILG